MNKKGIMLSAEVVAELLVVSLVIILFFGALRLIRSDTIHLQQKEVHEIALLKDASLASPNELKMVYNVPGELKAEIDPDCRVKVEEKSEDVVTKPSQYFCAVSKDQRLKTGENKEKNQLEVEVA